MEIRRVSENDSVPSTVPRVESPDSSPEDEYSERMRVNVLYTTHAGTIAALKAASQLSAKLCTRPRVLRPYVVPFSLPLEKPAVSIGFLEKQIHALGDQFPLEIDARVILCRDRRRSVNELLPPHSLVLVGGRKRWWRTKEQRWASWLKKNGHEVIFVEQE